jgi:hypothetical protein
MWWSTSKMKWAPWKRHHDLRLICAPPPASIGNPPSTTLPRRPTCPPTMTCIYFPDTHPRRIVPPPTSLIFSYTPSSNSHGIISENAPGSKTGGCCSALANG